MPKPETDAKPDPAKPERPVVKCLCCPRDAASRGLCTRCYGAAVNRVKNGEVTWEQLEKAKLARPSKRADRAPNPFVIALESARKATQPQAKK